MKSWNRINSSLEKVYARFKSLLFASAILVVTSGCAFTRTPVTVHLAASASEPLNEKPAAQLSVGQVKDTRPVKDGLVLTQKYNGYGQRTSGAYVAQEPISEIFKKGLATVLEKNGFISPDPGKRFELRADIQEFEHDVISGFVKATVTPKLIVRFQLIDTESGGTIWHDTFVGRQSMETAWGNSSFLVETFNKAADDVFRQLISDIQFRDVLTGRKK